MMRLLRKHEAKRTTASTCGEATLHRAKPCIIFHAPQVRFTQKALASASAFFWLPLPCSNQRQRFNSHLFLKHSRNARKSQICFISPCFSDLPSKNDYQSFFSVRHSTEQSVMA